VGFAISATMDGWHCLYPFSLVLSFLSQRRLVLFVLLGAPLVFLSLKIWLGIWDMASLGTERIEVSRKYGHVTLSHRDI